MFLYRVENGYETTGISRDDIESGPIVVWRKFITEWQIMCSDGPLLIYVSIIKLLPMEF